MQVKSGDIVQVHYKGTLTENGELFDSSEGRPPLDFTVGSGMVIQGFDNGVLGMKVGEKKTVLIPCIEAYGPISDDMIIKFPKSEVPAEMGEPEVGMHVDLMDNEGNHFPVEIIEVTEDTVILDGNHHLAGKDLTFEIELLKIGE